MFNSKTRLPSEKNRTNLKNVFYKAKPRFFKNKKHREAENPEKTKQEQALLCLNCKEKGHLQYQCQNKIDIKQKSPISKKDQLLKKLEEIKRKQKIIKSKMEKY